MGTQVEPADRSPIGYPLADALHRTGRGAISDPSSGAPVSSAAGTGVEPGPIPARLDPLGLQTDDLRRGLSSAGCVHLPGLLDPATVTELIADIDEAFDGYDRWECSGYDASEVSDGFTPFIPDWREQVHYTRPWQRRDGGVFTADSPRMLERWFGLLTATGITEVIAGLFDEVPVTSLDKCALRRIAAGGGIEWHQDGAFLGADSGAVNLWVTLSDTDTAPGLELVSRRFDHIVDTGTGGANYDWSVGPEVITELSAETPVIRPRFAPGDAFIFDGFLLHRTAQDDPPLPKTRYAIETWFFRPSRFPSHQRVPLAFAV